jgi:hypothetical protein
MSEHSPTQPTILSTVLETFDIPSPTDLGWNMATLSRLRFPGHLIIPRQNTRCLAKNLEIMQKEPLDLCTAAPIRDDDLVGHRDLISVTLAS